MLSNPLDDPLNLASLHPNATRLPQEVFGLYETGFIGPLQANEPGQGGRTAFLQSQGGIRRIKPRLLARMVIGIPHQFKDAKNPLYLHRHPALAHPARFGLASGIDPVGGLLEEHTRQFVGRLEDGGADQ